MEWQVSYWDPAIYIPMGTITSPTWLMRKLRQTGT